MTPATYVVTFTAADGRSLSTQVTLEPDRQYHPEELVVQRDLPVRDHQPGPVLTVQCAQLPSESEFREAAARAATRAARSGDAGRKIIDTLIPF